MRTDSVSIQCPNPLCQAPNPESHKFCYQCRTALPKRYLWAVGEGLETQPSQLLANRYLFKQDRIFLDTQPGITPETVDEVDSTVEAYLKLATQPLHVPQIYAVVGLRRRRGQVLLLEHAPIYPEGAVAAHNLTPSTERLEGHLMPAMMTQWKTASAFRQLNWLWQIAQLWQPLSLQSVASSLLQPDLLRVEGGLVRLLELHSDSSTPPTLASLGRQWQQWQAGAQPEIAEFLAQLCQQMQHQMVNGEQLVDSLDAALATCSPMLQRQIQVATLTDQGPSRQQNEDACYPPNGTVLAIAPPLPGSHSLKSVPPVIVCDGIGGHEGGDVASNLAIATLAQKLQQVRPQPETHPLALTLHLEQATLSANQVISQRNDTEHRQERQRMGTTLVMALVQAHELYLTHVGDSRAYRISRTGCRQMTLDDDLAAREVRLGLTTYRQALLHPGSGSLVQALGMGASSLLHPTVQRWILDEDCLFLLCSDGLSDNDRVEEHWQTELLPVLEGTVDLATAAQRLVAIANQQNGHDNVTVGLILCQVAPTPNFNVVVPTVPVSLSTTQATKTTPLPLRSGDTAIPGKIVPRTTQGILPLLVGLLGVCALGSLLVFLIFPGLRRSTTPVGETVPTSPAPVSPSPASPILPPNSTAIAPPAIGSFIQVSRSSQTGANGQPLAPVLLPQPGTARPTAEQAIKGEIPVGTVLQVVSRQLTSDGRNWLRLKVCSVPLGSSATPFTIQSGESGWAEEDVLAASIAQITAPSTVQLGQCAAPVPPKRTTSSAPDRQLLHTV